MAELNQYNAKLEKYIDDTVVPCNEMSYSLQLVPGSSNYPQPAANEFSQTVLIQEIGSISDLKASKGYFSDRVDLEWNTLGNFDSYRVRRVEYGKSNSDTILVGNVNAVGSDKMITEDTKGSPGVYYTYLVEGIVSCSGKKMYTPVLTDIGLDRKSVV